MSNGLDVALMKDPYGEWSPDDGDCHTEIAFSFWEWESFFFKTLGAKRLEREYGVSYNEAFHARDDLLFKESLKNFPLLARIDEFYQDASFSRDEIAELYAELKQAEMLATDVEAKAFLAGMLEGCRLASSANLGICLLSS
jgi:hypothetical protein